MDLQIEPLLTCLINNKEAFKSSGVAIINHRIVFYDAEGQSIEIKHNRDQMEIVLNVRESK